MSCVGLGCDYEKALWPGFGVWLGLYEQDMVGKSWVD